MFDGNILARNIHPVRPNFSARESPEERNPYNNSGLGHVRQWSAVSSAKG
jgi:hypothetical protein